MVKSERQVGLSVRCDVAGAETVSLTRKTRTRRLIHKELGDSKNIAHLTCFARGNADYSSSPPGMVAWSYRINSHAPPSPPPHLNEPLSPSREDFLFRCPHIHCRPVFSNVTSVTATTR